MAHAYYNLQWQKAMEELSELVEIEQPPTVYDTNGKPIPLKPVTWNEAYRHYALLYIRYLQVMRKLEECYDQIVHPQKRRDVRVSLDLVISRIYQLKHSLYTYGPGGRQSDFPNLDGFLIPLGLTPQDLEVPIPRYFRERQPDEENTLQNRLLLARCMDEMAVAPESRPLATNNNLLLSHLTRAQAVAILQRTERGRQGMQRALLAKEIKLDNAMRVKSRIGAGMELSVHSAATVIQRHVRGWLCRRRLRQEARDELVFLGMAPSAGVEGGYDPVAKEAQVRKSRKARQADHELQYSEALVSASAEVEAVVGAELRDAMWEERYAWWVSEQKRTGKAPKNLNGYYEWLRKQEQGEGIGEEEKQPEKQPAPARGGASAASRSGTRGGSRGAAEEESVCVLEPSPVVLQLRESVCRYAEVWAYAQEADNLAQTHDMQLARAKLLPVARAKVQEDVDRELLVYLQNLQGAVKKARKAKKALDTAANTGTSSGSSSGSGSAGAAVKKATKSGEKGEGKGRRVKRIDGEKACADMSLATMMSALTAVGVVREGVGARPLSAFEGEMNVVGSDIEACGVAREATLQQLRQAIADTIILPLGCKAAKAVAPEVNALLLFGAQGTGKSMLAHTIAHEAHAVLLDLSPSNLLPRVRTKADVQKVCYMAYRVAKEVQPCVIHIDGVEQLFLKKGKKGAAGLAGLGGEGSSKTRASLLAQLRKSIWLQRKALPTGSRILTLGLTRLPYAKYVSTRELARFFDSQRNGKIWYCPCPDHATRIRLWTRFIEQAGVSLPVVTPGRSSSNDVNVSLLAKVSEGFPAGSIEQACVHTLTAARVERLAAGQSGGRGGPRRMRASELLRTLSKTYYMYQQEYVQYANFLWNVCGAKERSKLLLQATLADAEKKSKNKATGGRKKKAAAE